MSKSWMTRPSQLLGLVKPSDAYAAWCLDEIIFGFGKYVENELNEVQDQYLDNETRLKKNRINQAMTVRLNDILDYVPDEGNSNGKEVPGSNVVTIEGWKGQFKDPADLFRKG